LVGGLRNEVLLLKMVQCWKQNSWCVEAITG